MRQKTQFASQETIPEKVCVLRLSMHAFVITPYVQRINLGVLIDLDLISAVTSNQ